MRCGRCCWARSGEQGAGPPDGRGEGEKWRKGEGDGYDARLIFLTEGGQRGPAERGGQSHFR